MFKLGGLDKLASSLMSGEENFVTKIIEKKIEKLGDKLISDLFDFDIPGIGVAQRITSAVTSGGVSEGERARDEWLNTFKIPPLPIAGPLNKAFNALAGKLSQAAPPPAGAKKYLRWDQSRHRWLDESWKHDWRTQPRDVHGRWQNRVY